MLCTLPMHPRCDFQPLPRTFGTHQPGVSTAVNIPRAIEPKLDPSIESLGMDPQPSLESPPKLVPAGLHQPKKLGVRVGEGTAGRSRSVKDPDDVLEEGSPSFVHPEIQAIVDGHLGAPRTAEVVAHKLLSLYGPFSIQNTPANRRAIIQNLLWVANTGKGLDYDSARAEQNSTDTHTPNETLSRGSGICRDIHVATSAILGALMDAKRVDGQWRLGSPSQSAQVQTIAFHNPDEFHAFMVYRDPTTGAWNAFEYNKHYLLQSESALSALTGLVGYASGFTRYSVTGWDRPPAVNNRGVLGAAAAVAFLEDEAGPGKRGDVRLGASGSSARATAFVRDNVALVGQVELDSLDKGLAGGLKLDVHRGLEPLGSKGKLHAALGLYSHAFEATPGPGVRGAQSRVQHRSYLLGLQFDGRLRKTVRPLVSQALQARFGLDWNLRLGLPLMNQGDGGMVLPVGVLGNTSAADLGFETSVSGRHRLTDDLHLEWALGARATFDTINIGTELITSEGTSARQSLVHDPYSTEFLLRLTHETNDGTIQIESGGRHTLGTSYASEGNSGNHFGLLRYAPKSRTAKMEIFARGESLPDGFNPVSEVGVIFSLDLTRGWSLSTGINAGQKGAAFRALADRLMVSVELGYK